MRPWLLAVGIVFVVIILATGLATVYTLVIGALATFWVLEARDALSQWRTVRRELKMLDHEIEFLS